MTVVGRDQNSFFIYMVSYTLYINGLPFLNASDLFSLPLADMLAVARSKSLEKPRDFLRAQSKPCK